LYPFLICLKQFSDRKWFFTLANIFNKLL